MDLMDQLFSVGIKENNFNGKRKKNTKKKIIFFILKKLYLTEI